MTMFLSDIVMIQERLRQPMQWIWNIPCMTNVALPHSLLDGGWVERTGCDRRNIRCGPYLSRWAIRARFNHLFFPSTLGFRFAAPPAPDVPICQGAAGLHIRRIHSV